AVALLKTSPVDVAIVDINLPDVNGIELTARINKEFPKVKVLAMSTFKERSYISRMIQSGASGYLVKSASAEEIAEAVLTAYEGKLYLSLDLNAMDVDRTTTAEPPILSRREKEVLEHIAEGFTNPQI